MVAAPVLEQTCRSYLDEIKNINYLSRADLLGVSISEDKLLIPLYNKTYAVSADSIVDCHGGKVAPAVSVILCKYVLTCPPQIPPQQNRLMTYREFSNSAPLVSYFTTNTNKTLESTFSGKIELFSKRAKELGAEIRKDISYDLSLLFYALPRIPVIVNFNDRDDLFEAACSILYKESAQCFLDMECLALTATLLAGKLIRPTEVC
jgi:hypothetical protein